MTRLRRPLLTLLAIVLPGAPQALGRRWATAALLGLPTVTLVGLVAGAYGREGVLGAALDPTLIDRTGWALVALGALAAISVTEVAVHEWAHPAGTVARVAGVLGVVTLAAVPATAGTAGLWFAGEHADTLNQVFRGGAVRAVPSEDVLDARTSNDDADTADTPTPASTRVTAVRRPAQGVTTTVDATPAGRWNVVLFGGDAGKGRSGLRTDAMVLVSVDRRTGDTALVSVPRNLARLPMPEGPLRDKFPKGWGDLANAFYGYVARNPSLGDGTEQAPANALKGALAEALGVPIDNYVLVDMGGFIDVIDALGGVSVNLSNRIPSPGNPYEARHGVPAYLGPGPVQLDGTTALAYARSREGDSDYRRMERQRCLLASAARQVSPTDLLKRYDDLLGAMERSVRSDLTPAQARQLVDLYAKVYRDAIRSLGLAPPLVNTGAPDYADVRRLVAETLTAPTPEPAAAAVTAPTAGRTASTTSTVAPTTAAASRGATTTSTVVGAVVLDEESSC